MPICSQCRSTVQRELTSCPSCGAPLALGTTEAGLSAEDVGASEPEPDPARASAVDANSGFETGPRRRLHFGPALRGDSRRLDPPVRLVPRIHGALALDSQPPRQRERSATPEPRRLHAAPDRAADVVPLRPEPVSVARTAPLEPPSPHSPAARDPAPARPPAPSRRIQRPPVLASEALRKELVPATPASRSGRLAIIAIGLVGLAAALLTGATLGLAVPLGGAFLALAALGVLPMSYPTRAAATATLGMSGLIVVIWTQLQQRGGLKPLVLMTGAVILATALLFRSWHRASLLARALVAVGIALCTTWIGMNATLHQLLVPEGTWQHWLPPLLSMPLPVLLLLSLLAFMDSRSTGGAAVWACLLLGWYTLFSWAGLIQLAWLPGGLIDRGGIHADLAISILASPLFVIVVAQGVAQLLAAAGAAITDHRPT